MVLARTKLGDTFVVSKNSKGHESELCCLIWRKALKILLCNEARVLCHEQV